MGPLPSPTLISACLDDMVQALSDRGEPSEARRADNARAAMTVILSFLPGDVLQMMLAGQAAMFNALIADAGRDVLRGMADTLKLRAQANVTGMGRVLSKHLDTLIRLQGRLPSVRAKGKAAAAAKDTDVETGVEMGSGFGHDAPPDPVDSAAAGSVSMPVDKASMDKASVDKAPSVPVNGAAAGARPVPAGEALPMAVNAARAVEMPDIPDPSTWRRPETESWLDDPYKEWVLDTPAALAARAAVPEVKRKTAALSIARG